MMNHHLQIYCIMKRDIRFFPVKSIQAYLVLATLLLAAACKKEKALEPSNGDENHFIIKDNPADPADHAIYQFYQSTGIACFYNDTIAKKEVRNNAGIPQYAYIKLSLSYSLFGNQILNFKYIPSKAPIPALMTLLKEKLIPRLPKGMVIPSILLVDSLWNTLPVQNTTIVDGWTALQGFNTVAIKLMDVEVMNNEDKEIYIASILAGLAEKKMSTAFAEELQKNFFSISRQPGVNPLPFDIYYGLPFYIFMDPATVPEPGTIGFLKYINVGDPMWPPMYLITPPREMDDIRTYLTAAFRYSTAAFNNQYAGQELILQKFNIIRNIAEKAGFSLPD